MIPNEAHQYELASLRSTIKRAEFQVSEQDKTIKEMRLKLLLAGISESGDAPRSDVRLAEDPKRLENPMPGLQVKQTAVNNVCGLLIQLGYVKTVGAFQLLFRDK